MQKGLFITFEGIDGSGKTTQLNLIKDFLENKGCRVIVTREPGSLDLGKKIREILLHYEGNVSDRCEMFLFLADRAQHVDELIKPYLEQGFIVLCDRHSDSTIAYQGYARGQNIDLLTDLNNIAVDCLTPDLTLLYDIEPDNALKRVGTEKDRMELAGQEFYKKVREGYLKLKDKYSDRIRLIDADREIEEVFKDTKKNVLQIISEKEGV